MKKIAIIPARGGSKRIPRKNIKPFLGKPIIAYSIQAALQSGLFDEVMVSTDDAEIASVAKKFGANVPFMRSAKNADDFATTVDVLIEVINQYKTISKTFIYGCCIYPTAPFVSKASLSEAFELLEKKNMETVFPILPFSFPIQRAVKINEKERVEMFEPQHLTMRSQDIEASYHDAGQFYWFNIQALLKNKKLWTKNTGAIILNEFQAQDIDNPTDWKLAELKYKMTLDEKN